MFSFSSPLPSPFLGVGGYDCCLFLICFGAPLVRGLTNIAFEPIGELLAFFSGPINLEGGLFPRFLFYGGGGQGGMCSEIFFLYIRLFSVAVSFKLVGLISPTTNYSIF